MKKNRLKGSIAYLAGPMDEVPDGGQDWRTEISSFLFDINVGVINPCNKPTTMAPERPDNIQYLRKLKEGGQYEDLHNQVSEIVSIDLRSVDLSSFIIANVDKKYYSCGTFFELTHAEVQRKPIIVHCAKGLEHIPSWLYGILDYRMFFDSWGKVKTYLKHIAYNQDIELLNRWKFFDYDKIYNRELFQINWDDPTY